MDNRLIVRYHPSTLNGMGRWNAGTRGVGAAAWKPASPPSGGLPGIPSRRGNPTARCLTNQTRKASPECSGVRTANRLRWAGGTPPRRTREPSLRNSAKYPRNFGKRGTGASRSQRKGPGDCLTKTQVPAEGASRRIGADACPVLEG